MARTNKSLKFTVVGNSAVGKSYICTKGQGHPENFIPTILEKYEENITVDGDNYSMTLWDTPGAEDYDSIRPLYYPNTDCFKLCYSISSRPTYELIPERWISEIKHFMPSTPIVLVANKIDLRERPEKDFVTTAEGMDLKKITASAFVECSALTVENLHEVFEEAVRSVVRKRPVASSCCLVL